ncbi:RNA degradosome polyphosphate kinase [Weissella paramesenteroides]|uniref:RNA degradosome polyphosphate kinase n=1 Tax=Weissella paramesenteroides TaxID=1249 RepID=UPI0013DB211B|nr:RNA degradosome polyphosphate kinase [Weissella paramesenteroides]NEZ89646.1 RNA degradosome polyphosphate kinase [Weissella paramesenteroides]NFB03971.1 RNA degradosome polyphosphate kinase [Weissella paramesenteroides]
MAKIDYEDPHFYTNRELSWLDFNDRVLEEARNRNNPLLERLKFLGITQSNMDEFVMIRVASLAKLIEVKWDGRDASGLSAEQQLKAVNDKAHEQLIKQYTTLNRILLPAIKQVGINLLKADDLVDDQFEFIKSYFHDEIYPVLTPMADDTSRPFPFIGNDTINLSLRLSKKGSDKSLYATLQVPSIFPRVVKLPAAENDFILLEDIIKRFVDQLFVNYKIHEVSTFRVIRDMDLDVAEEDTSDLLKEVQQQLTLRAHGKVIRLEVESDISKKLRKRLVRELGTDEDSVYEVNGPVDLNFLGELSSAVTGKDELRYAPFQAYQDVALNAEHNIFDAIKERDRLMQHPYDKFDSVVEFIRQASIDKDVLAIKMTLYRVSGNSPIIKYLGRAAQNGKQVTVLVEVKARFDEENNVHWARQLERMGCHVIYGLVGLKTHSKLSLVVRREESGIRRYVHLGTGNYNDITAHFYTDIGLLTANNNIGIDVTNIFNMLSGYSRPPYFHKLHISPNGIREFILDKLDQAINYAKFGRPVHVQMKMNSLSDQEMIAKMYEASHEGVTIDLIIRGICCLKPGIKGISETIRVHSIVGRFLEHSRIYIFDFEGEKQVYLSSADLMTRNLNRRVEQLFPIEQPDLARRVLSIYRTLWDDNVKTRVLGADGTYSRVDRRGRASLDAQDYFAVQATQWAEQQQSDSHKQNPNQFQPMLSPENQHDPLSE